MSARLDPLETARQIEDNYKRYLKTLLVPREPLLANAFEEAIDSTRLLTKGPLLELTPPYETGRTPQELIDEGVLHADFQRLHSDALPMGRPLYVHQEVAVRKFLGGRNLVVSTGTGSGKTESFLIPILNGLIAEHAQGTLDPGVRALLLYPMNALANDQLKRLRQVLGAAPEITFGRYTGETLQDAKAAESDFLANNPGQTRLLNELLSREEMRESPPHLLLTNYAMLEYLLLRPADIDLFDGPFAGTWRFIVLDEAHVYDGAQGSEVAMLLRRLKQRVASGAHIQCAATSASLSGTSPAAAPAEAMTFAQNLFDEPFEYDPSDVDRQDFVQPTRRKRRSAATWMLNDNDLLALARPEADPSELARLGVSTTAADALHCEQRTADLKGALAAGPVEVHKLASRLWPDEDAQEKLDALVSLGSRVHDESGNAVLSARYHFFVRATEGAFVSFGDDGPRMFLGRHEIDPDTQRAVFEFGTCTRCGAVHLAGELDPRGARDHFIPTTKADSSVRWLVLTDNDGDATLDEDELTLSEDDSKADPTTRFLCTGCGALTDTAPSKCDSPDCPGGLIRRVREHAGATRIMSRCSECGALSRQVIRRLRTDTNAAPAVVTTALYQQLPEADNELAEEVGGGRKLLMFSDSRQAAAFAAPYLDRTYSRLLERRYITQALQDPKYSDEPMTVDDLATLTRRIAARAGHFPESMGRVVREKRVNEWVMNELITLETRQSLEGLGLMRVSLRPPKNAALPRAFSGLGLSDDEVWSLLNELVKSARLQGALSLLDEVDIKDERFAPRNTRVRMRSVGSDRTKRVMSWLPSGRPGTTNRRMTFVAKVLHALGSSTPALEVLQGCWTFLQTSGYFISESDRTLGEVVQVDHEKLELVSGLVCDWYQCDSCRTLTPFSVRGVCPNSNCSGALVAHRLPGVELDINHYRATYQTMKTAPLAAKEHTAQWDAREAARIQRDFIDGRVNVLSCSTTFELGVDVGDLQSVVMRNMPPKTANYVQRAGRAGRRADAAALVVTYANRAAHDLAKYQHPESMIAGHMRIPWIPVDNARIGRRHAHSVALAAYFRHYSEQYGQTWRRAGEFFLPEDDGDRSPASRVVDFLTPIPPHVEQALQAVLPREIHADVGISDGSWVVELDELLRRVEADVINDVETFRTQIAEAAQREDYRLSARLKDTLHTIEGRELLGYLANRNVLPKYGFPVDTVELRTLHCNEPTGRKLELARDLALAVYDYAPGNEVVAGGKVWTSRGLRKVPGKELVKFKYRVCQTCNRFERGYELDPADLCPTCGNPFGPVREAVLPEFGFVADRTAHDVGTAPPERRWHGASFVENVGDEIDTYQWSGSSDATVSARAGTRARLAVISDGGGSGFHVCDRCGWAEVYERGKRRKPHQRPDSARDCEGWLNVLSLGHTYESDVAEITFDSVPYRQDAEAGWLSCLYAILEGASEGLEISRDDIDGALSWSADGRRSIVLFDTVPGGAGAAKRIAENVGVVLRSAVDRVRLCDCGPETSCYGCLRSYRNARVHDQLSRRGAMQILEAIGVDGLRSGISDAWADKLELAAEPVEKLLAELARCNVIEPEVGAEVGPDMWRVEAAWANQKVALVSGEDKERDAALTTVGYTVLRAEDVNAELVVSVLSKYGRNRRHSDHAIR